MSRTINQLKNEASELGFHLSNDCSIDRAHEIIAEHLWSLNHTSMFPKQFKVMLGKDASKMNRDEFDRYFTDDWVAELKINGCRSVMVIDKNNDCVTRLHSRRRSDIHHRYENKEDVLPHFKNHKWNVKGLTVIDGELLMNKESISTYEETVTKSCLQSTLAIVNSETYKGLDMQINYGNIGYWVFDILCYENECITNKTNEYRRKVLEQFVYNNDNEDIHLCPRHIRPREGFYSLYERLVRAGEEGIMLKNKFSPYVTTGRSKYMWKMKKFVTYDGFISNSIKSTEGKQFEDYIGGFEISAYINGQVEVIGNVSSIPLDIRKKATDIDNEGNIVLDILFRNKVVEVKGQEVTKNGKLAHCEIVRWRNDKMKEDCQIESKLYYK